MSICYLDLQVSRLYHVRSILLSQASTLSADVHPNNAGHMRLPTCPRNASTCLPTRFDSTKTFLPAVNCATMDLSPFHTPTNRQRMSECSGHQSTTSLVGVPEPRGIDYGLFAAPTKTTVNNSRFASSLTIPFFSLSTALLHPSTTICTESSLSKVTIQQTLKQPLGNDLLIPPPLVPRDHYPHPTLPTPLWIASPSPGAHDQATKSPSHQLPQLRPLSWSPTASTSTSRSPSRSLTLLRSTKPLRRSRPHHLHLPQLAPKSPPTPTLPRPSQQA